MVLFSIALFPLTEELRAADPRFLSPFYVDDVVFDGSSRKITQLLKLLMDRGPDRKYFPDPAKSLFISDTPGQEEAAKGEFETERFALNLFSGGRYLEGYLGPQDEFAAWAKTQVEAWTHGVKFLGGNIPTTPPVGLCWLGDVVAT